MDVSPCVLGLKAELGAVDGVVLSGAPSLKVQVSLSGWICAMLFLFNHELGCDEAPAKEYISGRVALVISGLTAVAALPVRHSVAPVGLRARSHLLSGSFY